MCGRFVSSSPAGELARYFGAIPPEEAYDEANYNVAPTSDVLVVYENGSLRQMDRFRWGLIPSWAKDLSIGNKMTNARSETVATKNAFRKAIRFRRCIIPADGFYEWTTVVGHRKKQPWYIQRADGEPMAFAGLWEVWRGGSADQTTGTRLALRSCSIITTTANDKMAELHDRMPVLLPPSAWKTWLDPDVVEVDAVVGLLVPAPSELISFHPVSTEVNNARNNGAHLCDEVTTVDPDGKDNQPMLRLEA